MVEAAGGLDCDAGSDTVWDIVQEAAMPGEEL